MSGMLAGFFVLLLLLIVLLQGDKSVTDEQAKAEVILHVGNLVRTRYDGDYELAFRHYDGDDDGRLRTHELHGLLKDSGVGNMLTRRLWVNGILKALDRDAVGAVSGTVAV